MKSVLKMDPVTLFIRITENCNARCFMCSYGKKKTPYYLEQEKFESVIAEAQKAKIRLVRFTGGETLLHRGVFDFIKRLKKEGFKTSTITNGYLLPQSAERLTEAGLDQLIVSIDGSYPELHNKLRNTPKLFENAISGIRRLKEKKGPIIIRVNSVVSPFNIHDLEKLHDLLIELDVDQWSVIPLKSTKNLWTGNDFKELKKTYASFQKKVGTSKKPRLLGFSKDWAGRTTKEVENYFLRGITITPRNNCNVVGLVRFYVPYTDRLLPCNCVAWRVGEIDFKTGFGLKALTDNSLSDYILYMYRNGPAKCTGCDPVNAYLGENPEILNSDLFAF